MDATVNGLRYFGLPALFVFFATTPLAGQVTLAFKAGAGMSRIAFTGVELDEVNSRAGMTVGASLTVPVLSRIGIELWGAFTQRGATVAIFQLGEISYRLNYVQLSALGKATVPVTAERVSLHLLAGPAVGLETSCKGTFTSALQPIVLVDECDGDRLNTPSTSLDFGVVGGVGTHFALADRVGISLDFLYTLGLRSTYDGELDRAARNRDMTVQAGLVLPIG